jgi:metal-responsive CopG/Arc/MetJ family transcriptional regulator
MASKVKVTVSLGKDLVKELEEVSRQRRTSRSQLIEEALSFWRRSQLEQQLKEGYQHMAAEDRATAERNLAAGWEIVK